MPQLVPYVYEAILIIWQAAVVTLPAWAPTAAAWAAWAIVIGGTYASIRMMQRAANIGSFSSEAAGRLTMTRDTIQSRRVIYGLNRVSGPMLFASTNGSAGKNEQLHLIVGIAGHQVTDFKSVYFNDILAWNSGSGNTSAYAEDKLAFQYKIGAVSQSAYDMTPPTEWTGAHNLNGIASIYTRLNADPAVYPNGIPNVSATVLGHTLQNTNLSDVNYYDNPALILLHYMRNYFGATESELNLSSFADARDACNYDVLGDGFKRYTCNYSFTLNTKPAKVIEDILKTCYGKLIYTNGQFFLRVGVYTSPTVVINEDDIIGSVAVTTKSSQANSFNSVRGLYINGPINPTSSMFLSPDNYSGSYQPSDFVPVTSSLYLAEDNGVDSPLDIELAGVTSHTVARRIAKLTLLDSRQDLTVGLTTKISGLQLIAGDNVQLPLERYGWASGSGIPAGGKVFEVNELTINPDLTVNLILKETVSTIYDFPVNEDIDRDLSPNTNLPNPFFVQPPAGFTVTETTTIDADGTIFPSATMLWSSSYSGSTADVGLEFKLTSSANFDSLGTVARTDNTFTTIDVEGGKSYTFRARNQNYLGVYSNYVTQSIKILGDTTRPQAPIGGTSVGLTGSLYVQWTNSPVDKDYKFTQVWLHSANNSASAENQGTVSGTSWNKTIVQSGSYYVWLKNIDTSGNQSDISSGGNAFVAGIAQGSPGPAGPSGSAGFAFTNIYKLGNIVPATPTGNIPVSGWVLGIPDNTGEALWLSSGLISSADFSTLSGSWSTPTRLSGRVSYFSNDAPVSGSNSSPVIGDIWFDTNDGNKIYTWNGTAWVSVQDEKIPSISGSIITMTSSIASISSQTTTNTSNILTNFNNILAATGSISNLYTQSFALSSSYGATSASLNVVYATFATKDFAIAVSAFSSSVAVNTATSSANAYTNNQLTSYATKTDAAVISAFSSSVAFNTATGSANAYTDNKVIGYATETYAQNIAQTTSTASFNNATTSSNSRTDTLLTNYASKTFAETLSQFSSSVTFMNATASANAYTITQLGGYATTNDSQAYSRQQITASINPGGVVSASNAASVAVNAAAVASLSGTVVNLSAEYGVSVTAGRVTGFKILSSPTVSDFTIQADKFAIVNSSGGSSKSPFIVSGGLTFIDGAVINRLDAGIITAGTISAAISINTPQITASGILVNSGLGMRCGNDSSVLTLTGGSVDNNNNGGQIDLVGNDFAGIGGVVQLIAGNEPTGHVLLKTGGDNIRLKVDYSGTIGINTSTPDTTSKLHVYGVTRAEGHVSCSGEITKITSDGFTVPMNDGSNAISQQWDGTDYNIKVDATTFTIAREGSDVSFLSVNTTSSERYKKNIRNLNGSYELIDLINPVVYDLKDDTKVDQLGFVAESIYEVLPSLVHKNKEGLVDSLDYSKFTPLLLDCVKKQKKLIEDLEARLARLENK